jgi:hypothetical protein
LGVIRCEILNDIDGRVPHVSHTHRCCRCLCVDEIAQITELHSKACVARIIDEDKQLQPSLLFSSRDPVGHLNGILTLPDFYILATEGRHSVVVRAKWLNHHHHVYRDSARR